MLVIESGEVKLVLTMKFPLQQLALKFKKKVARQRAVGEKLVYEFTPLKYVSYSYSNDWHGKYVHAHNSMDAMQAVTIVF